MKEWLNHYARLGLQVDASSEDIRQAYRRAARKLHPDTNTAPGETEFFLQAQEAFDVLSDPNLRLKYDSALPEEAKSPPNLSITTLYSAPTLQKRSQPQVVYALVNIEMGSEAGEQSIPPLNIGLVVDSSTSMQGEVMESVKSTVLELIHQLHDQDRLCLVAFSDRARILLPASDRFDREQAARAVNKLHPHGATEIFSGLAAGFQEIQLNRLPNAVSHIFLLTDGRTYGDEQQCYDLADQAGAAGVVISALGIGSRWNDAFLDSLAAKTGGSSQYVCEPSDIRKILNEKMKLLEKSYADRLAYDFTTGPGVSLRYAMRTFPDVSVLEPSSPLQLGSISAGSALCFLMELHAAPQSEEEEEVLLTEGRLLMEIPSRLVPKVSVPLITERPILAEPIDAAPPQTVMQAVSRMTLYRMQEKAQADVSAGRFAEATRRLQYLATRLLSHGEQKLAQTVMQEVSHIQEKQDLSEEGRKQIKYGTRALLLPAVAFPESRPGSAGGQA
jgi:Ca-activated chloride channel homolog